RNRLAMGLAAIAPDNLSHLERKSVLDAGVNLDLAAPARGDVHFGQQNFTGAHEEIAAAQGVEKLAVVVERGNRRQLHVVDVHVGIKLMRGVDLKYIGLGDEPFLDAPVGHIIYQLEGALAEPWRREIRWQCFPARSKVMRIDELR